MTERRWTVREVLAWTTELFIKQKLERSARLDAELLLARVLGCKRLGLYLDLDRPLDARERAELRALVVRRANGEPVAYLLGRREFYGLDFAVDSRVLIPRPETELLVDEALARLPQDATGPVVDLGTGSGAIAAALAHERPHLRVLALELDAGAAQVAQANLVALKLAERVLVVRGHLLHPLRPASVALIVSNPPYIAQGDPQLEAGVARWEPGRALYGGGPDGLGLVRRIVAQAARLLTPAGRLLLEVGAGQAATVATLAARVGLRPEAIRPDLAGIERVVILQKPLPPSAETLSPASLTGAVEQPGS